MTKQPISYSEVIHVPPEIATCPYCGGALAFTGEAWEQNDDGTWGVSEIDLECMASENREFSIYCHYRNDNVWLPVGRKVKNWANNYYDFDVVDWDNRLKKWCEAVRGV